MKATERLFVYGSWHPGYVHYTRLKPFVAATAAASVRGSVYRSPIGFPLFINEGGDRVPGMLLMLRPDAELAKILQQQGALPIECLANSRLEPALIFASTRDQLPQHAPKIARGDWEMDLKRHPDLVSRLTPTQKQALERLGASTAPTALDPVLYRELLKMELITDTGGARPTLSLLGRQLFQHLPPPESLPH